MSELREGSMQPTLVWLGISAIYLGSAGAAGAFWRRASEGAAQWLPASYATIIALGGATLILSMPGWATLARLLLIAAGLAVAVCGICRPSRLPRSLWRRAFGHGYLAGAMALAALWGLSQGLSGPSPLLIGLSALGAGAASSGTALARDADVAV